MAISGSQRISGAQSRNRQRISVAAHNHPLATGIAVGAGTSMFLSPLVGGVAGAVVHSRLKHPTPAQARQLARSRAHIHGAHSKALTTKVGSGQFRKNPGLKPISTQSRSVSRVRGQASRNTFGRRATVPIRGAHGRFAGSRRR